jgi:thiamine-monophosphate kinase
LIHSVEYNTVKVHEIGEHQLLKRLHQFCPATTIGDDAAVIPHPTDTAVVITTDLLIDGVHFSRQTTSAEDVGWRATAANLSDLAAMGASPLGLTVGLGLTSDTEVTWIEQVYQGMRQCLQKHGGEIFGGDVVRSPVNTLAITALGEVAPQQTLLRSAAQPGDAIVITGYHGASRAGLEILLHPEIGQHLTSSQRQSLIKAHQRPHPRFDVLPLLWEVLPSDLQRHYAGMDSSDGLADAIVQICQSSQVGALVNRQKIPILEALPQLVSPQQSLEWVLYGGEDFELVLCLPKDAAQQLTAQLGAGAAIVGEITEREEIWLVNDTHSDEKRKLTQTQGFQHF